MHKYNDNPVIDPFIDQNFAKCIKSKQWFNLDDTLEIK